MKKSSAVLMGLALWAWLGSAPPASAEPPSPKAKAVLDEIQRNPSPQALRQTLKQFRLTEAEAQEVENALKKPPYDAAFQALKVRAEAERFGPPAPPPAPPKADLEGLRRIVAREHAARLATLQAQAQPGLQAHVQAAARPRAPNPALAARMAAFSGARAPSNPSPVEFIGTNPEPALTGGRLVITGRNFGRQGELTIIVGAEDPRHENAFDCRIARWGAEAIEASVPVEIEEMHRARPFPNGQRSALVWVKPQGDASGRWRQITVKLDPDHFEPVIDSAPAELTPGLRFALRGRNLSAGRSPRVVLTQYPLTPEAELRVLGYDADWIDVLAPDDLSGLRAPEVGLWVSNYLKESRHKVVGFTPVEEVVEFRSPVMNAWSYDPVDLTVHVPPGSVYRTLGVIGVEKRAHPFDRIRHDGVAATYLSFGWRVVAVSVSESERVGLDAGCYLEHAATVGGLSFSSTELVGWANSGCRIDCLATLTIRGPRGVRIGP